MFELSIRHGVEVDFPNVKGVVTCKTWIRWTIIGVESNRSGNGHAQPAIPLLLNAIRNWRQSTSAHRV